MTRRPNNCVQATPDCPCVSFLNQESGEPDAERRAAAAKDSVNRCEGNTGCINAKNGRDAVLPVIGWYKGTDVL